MDRDITIDTSIGDMIEWGENGDKLVFNTEPDKFKVLAAGDLDRLNAYNQGVYSVMRGLYESAKRVEANPPTPGLRITSRYISPGNKLAVMYPPGFKDKFHPAWLRCEEERQNIANGYTVVTDDDVITNTPHVGGGTSKLVGDSQYKEYVLMKLPKEEWDRRQAIIGENSQSRIERVETGAINQMRQAGGQEYVPPEGGADAHNWGPPGSE